MTWRQHSGNFENPINPEYEQEARLVEQARGGSERAFSALLARYQQPVFRLIFYLVGEEEDARDLARIALKHALLHMPRVPSGFSIRPWLLRVAVLVALDAVRERSESPQQLLESLQLPAPPPTPKIVDADPTMDDTMVLGVAVRHLAQHPTNAIADAWNALPVEIERELIRRLLSGLPEGDAELLALGVVGQVPTRDLAALAGTSQRSIRRRIARALILFQGRYHEVRQEVLPPGSAAAELPRAATTSPLDAARRGLAQASERVRRGFQGAQVATNTTDAQERLETLRQSDLPAAATLVVAAAIDPVSLHSPEESGAAPPLTPTLDGDISRADTLVTPLNTDRSLSGVFDTSTWENWTAPAPTLETLESATVMLPVIAEDAGASLPTVHDMPTEVLIAPPPAELDHNSLEATSAELAYAEPHNTFDAPATAILPSPFGEDPGATMVAARFTTVDHARLANEDDAHTGPLAMPTTLDTADVAEAATLVVVPVLVDMLTAPSPAEDEAFAAVIAPEAFAHEEPLAAENVVTSAEAAVAMNDVDEPAHTLDLAANASLPSAAAIDFPVDEIPDRDAGPAGAELPDVVQSADAPMMVATVADVPEISPEAQWEAQTTESIEDDVVLPDTPSSDEVLPAASLAEFTVPAEPVFVAPLVDEPAVLVAEPQEDLPGAEFSFPAAVAADEMAQDEPVATLERVPEQPNDELDQRDIATVTDLAIPAAVDDMPPADALFAASSFAEEPEAELPVVATEIVADPADDATLGVEHPSPDSATESADAPVAAFTAITAWPAEDTADAPATDLPDMDVPDLVAPTASAVNEEVFDAQVEPAVMLEIGDEIDQHLAAIAPADENMVADMAPAADPISTSATEETLAPAAPPEEPSAEEPNSDEFLVPTVAMESSSSVTADDHAVHSDITAEEASGAFDTTEQPAADPADAIAALTIVATPIDELHDINPESPDSDPAGETHVEGDAPAEFSEFVTEEAPIAEVMPQPERDALPSEDAIPERVAPALEPLAMPQRSGHTVVMPPTQRADYLARHQPSWVDAGDLSGFAGVQFVAAPEDEHIAYIAPTVPPAGVYTLDEHVDTSADQALAANQQQGDHDGMGFDLADLAGLAQPVVAAHPEVAGTEPAATSSDEGAAVPVTVPAAEDTSATALATSAPDETLPGTRTRTPTRPMPRLERDLTDPPHEW